MHMHHRPVGQRAHLGAAADCLLQHPVAMGFDGVDGVHLVGRGRDDDLVLVAVGERAAACPEPCPEPCRRVVEGVGSSWNQASTSCRRRWQTWRSATERTVFGSWTGPVTAPTSNVRSRLAKESV